MATDIQNKEDHALIGEAKSLPSSAPTPVITFSPVVLQVPGRIVDLQIKISAPATGKELPIILVSHGHGQSNNLASLKGYSPLADFWAAHGFVVLQPTHLNSKTLNLDPSLPGGPLFWRSRVEDMKHIIDQLDHIESSVPIIQGRLDKTRIAVMGHSLGGHTAEVLLGAQLIAPEDGKVVNLIEPRIKAGVLLGAPGDGNGGKDISEFGMKIAPFFASPNFAPMTTPTLVVTGDRDLLPHLTSRGVDWHADPYKLSTGPKSLLDVYGAHHCFGGISGYDSAETKGFDDENPEIVAVVQRATTAYLRSVLYPGDGAWEEMGKAIESAKLGKVESK